MNIYTNIIYNLKNRDKVQTSTLLLKNNEIYQRQLPK